jgi:hypothetical protein
LEDLGLKLWNEHKHNPTNDSKNRIIEFNNSELEKCVEWFSSYYTSDDVRKKFKNQNNIKKLIDEISKVKIKVNLGPQGSEIDDAWGAIYTNDLYTIHINFYNFFNGKINSSVYDTIVHEMGHIVDFQLRSFRETPSFFEMPTLRPLSDSDMYIVSREEDYARVQRLRHLLSLSAFAELDELVEGLKKLVESNKMSIPNFKINFSGDKTKMIVEHSQQLKVLPLNHISWLLGNIIINDYLASDLGYLFAKYSKVNKGKIEVDLVKIVRINKLFVNKGKNNFDNFV